MTTLFKPSTGQYVPPCCAQQGGTYWPVDGLNRVVISEDDELPFQDSSIDRLIVVHSMECTEHLRPMLKEIWRILRGDGRLIIVVPSLEQL